MADETVKPGGEPPKIRLNLHAFGKPPTGPKDTPMPVKGPAATGKVETTRIDLSQAVPPASGTQRIDPQEASKLTTMRVEIVESPRKSETTRIDLAAAAPRPAARIDVSKEAPGTEDLFKRSTIAVGVPTPSPASRPKTIQVKRAVSKPGETLITPQTASPQAVLEARKSETARIDLPAEGGDRPVTRPKTIRIKRPDGTSGRKPLMIARPSEEGEAATVSPAFEGAVISLSEQPPGIVFSILAMVALLVACVVVYVLAAQTIAPTLPFPGRLA